MINNIVLKLIPSTLLIGLVTLYCYQNKLIYPSYLPQGARTNVEKPASLDLPYEEVFLETQDGERLQTYIIRPDNSKFPRPTIIMFGPNAGNIGHGLFAAEILYRQLHMNVVMISYRGYGKSTGSPSERGIKVDLRTLAEYLRTRQDIAAADTPVYLYGRSLGCAAAIYFATLELPFVISGIILENPFFTLPDVARVSVIPWFVSFLAYAISDTWQTNKIISKIEVPILFLRAAKDELVPPSHSQKLYDLAVSSKAKSIVTMANGRHNDMFIQKGYFQAIFDFVAQTGGWQMSSQQDEKRF